MPHCWKSHVTVQLCLDQTQDPSITKDLTSYKLAIHSTMWTGMTELKLTVCFKKTHFLISQAKHMLWVLKRTVSMRGFY